MTLLAAALASIPHATSFCPSAVAVPMAAAVLRTAHHSHSSHRCSPVRGRAAPLSMAASSAGEARAALLDLAEAGPKNGVGATEEQVQRLSTRYRLLADGTGEVHCLAEYAPPGRGRASTMSV